MTTRSSYLDNLVKTGSETVEATLPNGWILFAGFVAHMKDMGESKCAVLGELVRETDKKRNVWGIFTSHYLIGVHVNSSSSCP